MNDMKFTTAGEYMEDHTWILIPHGKQKHVAQWVVDNYEDRVDYEDNLIVQKWITSSKQILQNPNAVEKSDLFN